MTSTRPTAPTVGVVIMMLLAPAVAAVAATDSPTRDASLPSAGEPGLAAGDDPAPENALDDVGRVDTAPGPTWSDRGGVTPGETSSRPDFASDEPRQPGGSPDPAARDSGRVPDGFRMLGPPSSAIFKQASAPPLSSAQTGQELVVDDDLGPGECPSAAFNQIQPAVDAARPGDTVRVCTGTYTESVTIRGAHKAGLSLVADGQVFLDGETTREVGIHVHEAPNVRVEGFEIRDYVTGILAERTVLDFGEPLSPQIVENTIAAPGLNLTGRGWSDPGAVGVRVMHAANATVQANTISAVNTGVYTTGVTDSRVVGNEIAVRTDLDDTFAVSRGVFSDLFLSATRTAGTLTETVRENLAYPLHWAEYYRDRVCRDASEGEVFLLEPPAPGNQALATAAGEACPAARNATDPILFPDQKGTNNTYAHNTITAAGDGYFNGGILIDQGTGDHLVNNRVTDAEGSGIVVLSGTSPALRDNRVENSTRGLGLFSSTDAVLEGNTVVDTRYPLPICCSYATENYQHEISPSNTFNGKQALLVKGARDRVIDGDDPATVFVVDSTNVTVRDVAIENASSGVTLVNTTHSRVENVTVRDSHTGIELGADSRANSIANNTLTDVKQFGIDLYRPSKTSVTGNTITDIEGHLGVGIYERGEGNTLADNRIKNANWGGLMVAGASVTDNTVTASGHGISIDGSGSLVANNTFEENFVGIYLTGNGNTLRDHALTNNTYNFFGIGANDVDTSNTVNGKPIVYLVDAQDTVVDADSNAGYVTVWRGENVIVRDLELDSVGAGVVAAGVSDLRISNASVTNASRGIWLFASTDVEVTDTTVSVPVDPPRRKATNSLIDQGKPSPPKVWTVGLKMAGGSNVSVDNLTVSEARQGVYAFSAEDLSIENSTLSPSSPFGDTDPTTKLKANNTNVLEVVPAGVVQLYGERVTVANNHVSNATFGIVSWLTGSDSGEIRGNTVTQTSAGILSWASVGDRVVGNTVHGNTYGVLASEYVWGTVDPYQTSGLQVEGNTIYGNQDGVVVNTAPEAKVTYHRILVPEPIQIAGNTIEDNVETGVRLEPNAAPGKVQIHRNTIAGNGAYGVHNAVDPDEPADVGVGGAVDASNNFWGASDGPSSPVPSSPVRDPLTGTLADGAGDVVSEGAPEGVSSVRFDPWLTQSPDG